MDFERLKKLHSARGAQIEVANTDLPEAQKGSAEELQLRFKALTERMARYVNHKHYPSTDPREVEFKQISASRHIATLEGPMPEVKVRFSYSYRLHDGTMSATRDGVGFNEHGENIKQVRVEFIHSATGVSAEPAHGGINSVPTQTQYGEVFATESLSFGDIKILQRDEMDEITEELWGVHPSVRLVLIEQALDQYEAAPPSPFELREGLASV